jgi:hypothetical protein
MSPTAELFTAAGVWLVVAAFIAYLIPLGSRVAKSLLFVALVAIPFWELPYGYLNFRKECDQATKLSLIETIPSQESICLERFDSVIFARLSEAGFSRVEVAEPAPNAAPFLTQPNLFVLKRTEMKSGYCVRFMGHSLKPWGIQRSETAVIELKTGKRVAHQSNIRWLGTWWQSKMSPMLGDGGSCNAELSRMLNALRKGEVI